LGEYETLIDSDSLDGVMEEILKDTSYVYILHYPCIEGHPRYDKFTGRWIVQIGEFNHDKQKAAENSDRADYLSGLKELLS